MRAVIVIATTQRRGAELFGVGLARGLHARGVDAHVLAVEPAPAGETLSVPVLDARRWSTSGFRRLVREARGADVIVGIGSSALLHGAAAARVAGRPFVYRSIGDPAVWGGVAGANLRIGAPLRSATAIAVLYSGAGEEIHRRYGVDRSRLHLVPNGVDTDRFTPPTLEQRRAARERLGVPAEASVIGYLGALSEEKQPVLAIEAAAAVAGAVVCVAGAGPLEAEVRAAAERVGPRARVVGQVADVPGFLAAVDVVVLPSRTEGVPGALIEAGLMGIPGVGHDVGGVSSVVLDGVTGRVVASGDVRRLSGALMEVLAARDRMGRSAREHCTAAFALERTVERWRGLLEDVVGSGVGEGDA